MKIYRYLAVLCCLFVLPLLLTSLTAGKDTKKKIKGDVCSASNPAGICAAANTSFRTGAFGWLRGPATPRKRHSLILPYRFELTSEVAA